MSQWAGGRPTRPTRPRGAQEVRLDGSDPAQEVQSGHHQHQGGGRQREHRWGVVLQSASVYNAMGTTLDFWKLQKNLVFNQAFEQIRKHLPHIRFLTSSSEDHFKHWKIFFNVAITKLSGLVHVVSHRIANEVMSNSKWFQFVWQSSLVYFAINNAVPM